MCLTLSRTHFSIRGSQLALMRQNGMLQLRNIRTWPTENILFETPCPPDTALTPGMLTLHTGDTQHAFALFGRGMLLAQGTTPLTLTYQKPTQSYDACNAVQERDGRIRLTDNKTGSTVWLTAARGHLSLEAPWNAGDVAGSRIAVHIRPDEGGSYLLYIAVSQSPSRPAATHLPAFDRCVRAAETSFSAFANALDAHTPTEREAAYVLWSNLVPPEGAFPEEAMLMSKSGMCAVWSWDNCFNAMVLAAAQPGLAFSQFMLPYRHMDASGCLPDDITALTIGRAFTKPPIQGWAYRRMAEQNPLFWDGTYLAQAYPAMARNINWWLNARGEVPCYWHGNDSGADNATCQDACTQVQTGELLALLSVQSAVLSQMAERLGYIHDQTQYNRLADRLREGSLTQYWDGSRFFVRPAPSYQPYHSNSLMPWRAIVLGDRLPGPILTQIAHTLKTQFLAPFGLASEALTSPKFEEDGYWRGATWAPDQVLFAHNLAQAGASDLAGEIARAFRRACEQSGFYENFNPLTGAGQRCPAYTWSAAAYLMLRPLAKR